MKELMDMKRHPSTSTTSQNAPDRSGVWEVISDQTHAGDGDAKVSEAVPTQARPATPSAVVWRHKLILTGKLDSRSIPELEDEIECLCQEGVTTLTLDLRLIDAIDSTGATAIACRGAACKLQGHDFAVIPGSGVVRNALAEAGAIDLLTHNPSESVVRGFPSRSADAPRPQRLTAMIKSL
jgi:anti-anti-sigma regulatory factor